MPRHATILQIFVASPSDVSDERVIFDTVVAELNRTLHSNLGVTFEIIKWETHVRPGFDTDPQSVINSQIQDDYDILVGVFWSRLGTPTPRSPSGTIEEFERAYSRHQSTNGTPEIMLYFKDAPLSPSKIDPDQFASLQSFRKSISSRGGLFSTFEDQQGFEASLRAHLSAVAQNFANKKQASNQPEQNPNLPATTEVKLAAVDDEYGLWDYLEIYTSRTQDMSAAMDIINDATVRIGEQLTQRTSELQSQDNAAPAQARKMVKRAAEDMHRYAEILASQVSLLSSARHEALGAMSNAVAIMADFHSDREQLVSLHVTLIGTITAISTAKVGLIGMRQAASALPRISQELNKSKRAVVENLDKFLSEIEGTESTVKNIIDAMNRLMDQLQNSSGH